MINGQKTWTSGGQWADKCFALVRTDKSQKHAGISFLLMDMDADGVETKPIRLISGQSPFCETFFADVKVPKENLVGREGQGWEIGTRLLQHERNSLSSGSGSSSRMNAGDERARDRQEVSRHRCRGSDRRRGPAHPHHQARDGPARLRADAGRAALEAKGNAGPSAATSIMKNVGARITQDRAELNIEIMGMQGLGWEGEGFGEDELWRTRSWLWGKAVSIYGGSSEIQNNVIAKRILGMLDHQ
ncbi:acyl-CoA dehydrogenase family protein [Sphingomonas sp. MMS24-JH45]